MSRGEEIFNQIQKKARTDGVEAGKHPPTAEYLTRTRWSRSWTA